MGSGRFLNVCRHRGAQLCPAERGQTRTLQCRYHAWTYGLDGRLLRAPGLQDAIDFDRGAFGLVPVALDTWEGLVWVSLAADPPPVADQILPQLADRLGDAGRLAAYRMGALAVGRTLEYEVEANWKVIVENFMECYHCAPMHPELVRLLPAFRSGATQEYGLGTRLADDAEALTVSGRAPGPPFPGLVPGHERHYYGMVVRPNVFLNLLPDHVIVHTLTPLAPDRSRVTCDWLFDPGRGRPARLRPDRHGRRVRSGQPPGLGGLRVGPGRRPLAGLRRRRRLRPDRAPHPRVQRLRPGAARGDRR